ncbi:hypothetical protein TERTU_3727 [Teredinibacter turnerae T7901]|uniref:Uncharacterized protein n=1 Tax=Teredinibacter turnerae (strain ATCC 39867 / T7901) TaxID=377629 RepID=C5BSA9_TERTT|nr:hypothetical protein [Teredinibacter turnerae]ACR14312.1 hypothetical protein TERTU_3727 [Teredinibacter turnerae T7901]
MNVKPVLGDWEIPHIQAMHSLEQRQFVELNVPGRAGSLFQDMNTRPTSIAISGSLYGDEPRNEFLEALRGKYRAGEPVTFVGDIVTATEVQYVIIESLQFSESGMQPDQLDYYIRIKESPPPPPPPDPFGALDTDLLDQAGGFLDSVTGALDVIDGLGNVPNIGDPTPQVRQAMDQVTEATAGLQDAATLLSGLFGDD